MKAIVDGVEWRLRFTRKVNGRMVEKEIKGQLRRVFVNEVHDGIWGYTECRVEARLKQQLGGGSETSMWVPQGEIGRTKCGRSEKGFDAETGRQYALVRAMVGRNPKLVAALVTEYIKSGRRGLCLDLRRHGLKTLYQAAGLKTGSKGKVG